MSPTRVPNPMTIASSGLVGTDGRVTMLRLPPYHEINKYIEYFYEGSVTVTRGVALVPRHKHEWITSLLRQGYILEDAADADTQEIADANTASMELSDGAGFLTSLGYVVSGHEPDAEPTPVSAERDVSLVEADEPVAAQGEDDELPA